jgi:hypothetical protein
MRALILPLLLASAGALADPVEQLQPLAFLAGQCWRADSPGPRFVDEHCYSWVYGGAALRDIHTRILPSQPDYVGETIYYYNADSKKIEYLQFDSSGANGSGSVQAAPKGLVFAPAALRLPGKTITVRAKWTRADDQSYEMLSELKNGAKWVTQSQVVMRVYKKPEQEAISK